MNNDIYKIGFVSAALMTGLTLITFGIAFLTPPLSGPYCASGCYTYPFTDIASRFPRDYIWMYPAIALSIVFYILMTSLHCAAPHNKKIYSHIGLSFALISTATLVIDYVLQVSVIQPSVLNGEMNGIALLSQFNAHGIFIVLEETGFLMMSLSMLFMSPVFSGRTKIENILQRLFISCFILNGVAFTLYTLYYGIYREYRFEVATISIHWITLIVSGVLLCKFFNTKLHHINGPNQ